MGRPRTKGIQDLDILEVMVIHSIILLQVQKTWGREICRQNWGSDVRARVFARIRLGREPTADEIEDLSEEGSRAHSVTPEDIMAAFSSGEEVWFYIHGLKTLKANLFD